MGIPSSSLYQLWFPGESLWELWLIGRGKRPEMLERCEDIGDLTFRGKKGLKILALPTERQLAIPYRSEVSHRKWLHGDAKQHLVENHRQCDAGGIGLEVLEGKPPHCLVRIDAPVEHTARNLPGGIRPDFVVAAPTLLALPRNGIAIWKELGQQVVAFDRDGKTVCYEELPTRSEFETCLLLKKRIRQLESDEVITTPREIVLWNRNSPTLFESRLKLPAGNSHRPAPSRIKGASTMQPAWFRMQQDRAFEQQQQKNNFLLAGVALAFANAVFIALFFITAHQTNRQQERLAELQPEAGRVQAWKAQWQELATAVDRDASVLEIWRMLFAVPSSADIRISRMQVGSDLIEVHGEAKTIPGAMRFIDDISKNAELASFEWDYEEPELRRDGTAYFELVGIK